MQKYKITEELPKQFSFWQHLSKEEKTMVYNRLSIVQYQSGQLIHSGDSICFGLFLLLKGTLRAYLLSPEGQEITLYRLHKGEYCVLSASCVLNSISFDTYIDVEEDCEILLLPVDVFSNLMENNVYVQRDSYKMANERFSDVVSGMERIIFYSLEQRISSFLLDESALKKTNIIHMTHEQIALNINSAREVVSRTLKSMEKKGWVELFRGGVKIKDKAPLYSLIDQ